ncbi:MAG: hypothetical protein J7545_15635 [Roseofilum sp. SBFL]|uniref:hypothetical protein n=1 Tax=Roseofilum sp. SBFL TaxID=2821496 RepID=UPI001B0F624A|nr:hypothetical protein [Roseofilum sp. SBFL]MBP0043379.1 hypothetical protein [Roseofilum sp. SBFL]
MVHEEDVEVELFIPNAQAMEILGIKEAQYSTDLRVLRGLRDRREITEDFDSYPYDPCLSPEAFSILKRYRQLVRQAGARQAVNQIKREYGNQRE